MDNGHILIGEWTFDPSSNELVRGQEIRRLEDRTARVLSVLADRRGAVVTREQLIERVWGGRHISENSVATAVGQLRRAIGDSAREPALIETIPKRGYRLAPVRSGGSRLRLSTLALCATLLLGVAFAGWAGLRGAPVEIIGVAPIADRTGNPGYAPLARATDALVVDRLAKRGFRVVRHTVNGAQFAPQLVMWEGEPFLALSFSRGGETRWSAMIGGGKGAIPRELDSALDEWTAKRVRD
jgi:DNA-binding winged helix-turn-helix (wHTH) protein